MNPNNNKEGEGNIMELPEYVIENARKLVQNGTKLPANIPESVFLVAEEKDESVTAFGGFEENGVVYKIGAKK